MIATIGQLRQVLNAATNVTSEEKVKENPKKCEREQRLQTIMNGIVTQMLDSE